MWNRLKENLPKHWNTTRIENRYGGGIPDVHICADGFSFWIELKVTKTNRIAISSHQVAWNYAYYRSGGVSFYLVSPLLSPHLYLFEGRYGRELKEHGLATTSSGTVVPCAWSGEGRLGEGRSGEGWSGLIGAMTSGRDRIGIGSGIRVGTIGSGVGGNDNNWNSNSNIDTQELNKPLEKNQKLDLKNL